MEIKPIRIVINAAASAKDDALAVLDQHFHIVTEVIQKAHRERYAGATVVGGAGDVIVSINVVSDFLALMSRLDGEYGPDRALPIEDVPDAVDETLRCLAELESWLIRFDQADQLAHLQAVEIGVGYWAMRHGLPILVVEPIVNALATRSNAAESTQETAAVYAMMQGFINHFSPALKADLDSQIRNDHGDSSTSISPLLASGLVTQPSCATRSTRSIRICPLIDPDFMKMPKR